MKTEVRKSPGSDQITAGKSCEPLFKRCRLGCGKRAKRSCSLFQKPPPPTPTDPARLPFRHETCALTCILMLEEKSRGVVGVADEISGCGILRSEFGKNH